jgi:hypothetical protein
MNENKYREMLTACDVPEALDRRILSTARVRSAQNKRRRFILCRVVPAMGAAAAFAIGFGIMLNPADSRFKVRHTSNGELLAMNDWTELDQLNYNLTFELDDGMSALSDNLIAKGY